MAKFDLFEAYRELKEIEDEKQEVLCEAYRELKENEDEKQEFMDEVLCEAYAEYLDALDYSPVPDMEFLSERVAFLVSLRAKMDALEAEKGATTPEGNGSLSDTNEDLSQEPDTADEPTNEIEEEGEESKNGLEN